jgi:predicted HTH transcriptional regulator
MISLLKKENLEQSDIELIIRNQAEESTYLEFKSGESLKNSDKNKLQISKEVSAFANSDGGLIIYGIMESDHKAISLDFINGHNISKEWIENVIDSNIKRTIQDIRIFPIRFDSDIEKTIYAIKSPIANYLLIWQMIIDSIVERILKYYQWRSMRLEACTIKN